MLSTRFKVAAAAGAVLAIVGQQQASGGSGDTSSDSGPDSGHNRSIGREIATAQYGWGGAQWDCLETLWQNESNWEADADNPTSSAYGIPQAMMSAHDLPAGYTSSARVQIKWGLDYIDGRYGTPCSALSAWRSRSPHWY